MISVIIIIVGLAIVVALFKILFRKDGKRVHSVKRDKIQNNNSRGFKFLDRFRGNVVFDFISNISKKGILFVIIMVISIIALLLLVGKYIILLIALLLAFKLLKALLSSKKRLKEESIQKETSRKEVFNTLSEESDKTKEIDAFDSIEALKRKFESR